MRVAVGTLLTICLHLDSLDSDQTEHCAVSDEEEYTCQHTQVIVTKKNYIYI